MGVPPLPSKERVGPVARKQCLLGLGFSLVLRCLRFTLLAIRGPVALLAAGVACVRVGFLPGTLRIPIEAIPSQRTGLLPFARLLALVSTVFATALGRLIAALRPVVFATVAAVGLAFGLVGVIPLALVPIFFPFLRH